MENARIAKSHQILLKAFKAKVKVNGAYSQRALARDLGLSATFVTKILTGEKAVPSERYKKLFQVLNMDVSLQSLFIRSVVLESLPSSELRQMAKSAFQSESRFENYQYESSKQFGVLKNWYNIPILNYLTCETRERSVSAIATYFGLTEQQVQHSLTEMEKIELVRQVEGVWSKTSQHNYFPTTKSSEIIRDFHRQMIKKSYEELSKIAPDDFEKRLITSFSIAANPEHIEPTKKRIADFLGELSHELSEGSCQEVYQCNIQFFPLTGTRGKK